MKTMFLSVALLLGTLAYTEANAVNEVANSEVVSVLQQDGFVDVKIESLNAKVQEAVKGFDSAYTVKALAYDKAKQHTRVNLVAKADKKEKIVILDNDGKEVKDTKATKK